MDKFIKSFQLFLEAKSIDDRQMVVNFSDRGTCIYYANKGIVMRYPTGIAWEEKDEPENKKKIDDYVSKLKSYIESYRQLPSNKQHNNPPTEDVRECSINNKRNIK